MELSSRLMTDRRAWAEGSSRRSRREQQGAEIQSRNQLREVRSGIGPDTEAKELTSLEHRPDLAD